MTPSRRLLAVAALLCLLGVVGGRSRSTDGARWRGAAVDDDEDVGIDLDEDLLERQRGENKPGRVILPSKKKSFAKRIRPPDSDVLTHMADTIKGRVAQTISTAKQRSSGVLREMKGLLSSELEAIILKITRPSDNMPKMKHVENLLVATHQTPAQFQVYPGVLKKLWNRMLEPDWRTALKATYMLHKLAAQGAPQHGVELKKTLTTLSKEYCARHKNTYFNVEQALASRVTSEQSEEEEALLEAYIRFVLFRTKTFQPHFPEIEALRVTSKKEVSVCLAKCDKLIKLGKKMAEQCGEEASSEATAVCLERCLEDVAEMMSILSKKVEDSMTPETKADLQVIVDWFEKRFLHLKQWLRGEARTLSKEFGLSPRVSVRKLHISEKSAGRGHS